MPDDRDLLVRPFSLAELECASRLVHATVGPTPALSWPLLSARAGCEVFVKHENHLPTGAFKVRGGLWFMHRLAHERSALPGVVAATRGNHGQSVAYAAARHGLGAVIVVPHGNNPDKNRAMRALGAELIESGADFDAALTRAGEIARERGLMAMPSFHAVLVEGVASYALELFQAVPRLDCVYVPIGLGSGACGLIAARDALGLDTDIVGVVAAGADAYAQSFAQGRPVATASADTVADGMAVRVPSGAAFAILRRGLARIVRVADAAILDAMRICFEDTHNLAEGAGAAALAALLDERDAMRGKRVAVILSGGNVDRPTFLRALGAGT
jgi:threonine dehydratase